jgi:proline iminopeptidase
VREGQGQTVVAVGSAIYYPKAYSAALRRQLDLTFVDSRHFVPGYQPSQDELARLSLDTFADDLDAVRRQLGIARWAVIGHSIHAQIAIAYARKYAEHTTHLVIVAGVPHSRGGVTADSFFKADASAERKAALAEGTRGLDSILAATPASRRFAVGYQHRAALFFADPRYDATHLFEGLESGPAFGRLQAVIPGSERMRQVLQEIKIPILVVLGRLDYGVPYYTWTQLAEGLPNITLRVLDADSHNPQTESPQRFDPILLGFLTKK